MGFQRDVRRELRSPEEILSDPGVITAEDLSGNRLVVASTERGKSAMPDHSELTANLVSKAFEVIGSSSFQVTASLDVERPSAARAEENTMIGYVMQFFAVAAVLIVGMVLVAIITDVGFWG